MKNDLITNDNIRKITISQGYDYKTGCFLDYPYFNENFKLIAIDLSKQQALDAGPKGKQQINFTGNLTRDPIANTTMFLIIEEAKETILDLSQVTLKAL